MVEKYGFYDIIINNNMFSKILKKKTFAGVL